MSIEVFSVGWNTALQEHIPIEVLSRVFSYDMLGSFVAIPVGTFAYGYLATHVSLEALLVVSGILYAALCLSALLSRSVRDLGHVDGLTPAPGSPPGVPS